MFGACCCANGGEGDVIDESKLVQDRPTAEQFDMSSMTQPKAPVAAAKEVTATKKGPAEPGSTFSVSFRRNPTEPIGLDIDLIDGHSAVIVDIKDGAVKSWNDKNPDTALRVNDRIIEVNGSRSDSNNLVTRLKSDIVWSLQVQRPIEFPISINRAEAPSLGMDLRYAPNGTTLMITQVGDGPMQDWNRRNPERAVTRHDRIIQLNGVRGSPPQLLQASEDAETLDLVIMHYPTLP
mmetsp:Transcript_56352/g.119926  ORF Transcript_56352/g.119926 Transcript_56352/m.119926 type:complete len:236 (-) Transcript_56352:148-855(-)